MPIERGLWPVRARPTNREWKLAALLLIPLVLAMIAAAMLLRPLDLPPVAEPDRAPTVAQPGIAAPPAALARQIAALGQGFDGTLGIAITSIDDGWTAAFNADRIFPQQSVRKLWVAAAILDKVDSGEIALDDPVTLTSADLTVFHQPIRKRIGNDSYQSNIAELLTYAMTQSDNAANDVLYRRVGGQKGVADFIVRKGLGQIAIGPEEKTLQTEMAGLVWNESFSYGRTFWRARERVPPAVRAKALNRYLAEPPDGATPAALAGALAKLARGELLSQPSTTYLLDLMAQSKTGPERLRGALVEGSGWSLPHKTGTGQVMGSFATAYNDVGILRSPNGRRYAIVAMIGSTRQPVKERQALMQAVTGAVITYDEMRVR
jgi:beta-lactamase class A